MKRILETIKRMRSKAAGRGLILLYHRVASPPRDPQALAVSSANFSDHLKILLEIATPMALHEMTRRVRAGRSLPDRAVAISFDDGYCDNIQTAEPLLRELGMQATVFVATGYVAERKSYWWDVVDTAVLGTLPEGVHELVLPWKRYQLDLRGPPLESDDWTALLGPPNDARRMAYADLLAHLKFCTPADMTVAIRALLALAHLSPIPELQCRPSTPDEIAGASRRGVLTFEAHTVNHPSLKGLSPEEQRVEIASGRSQLTDWLGYAPTLFAYPYGTTADYDETTARIASESGFKGAFINHPGIVRPGSAAFFLPRILIRNIDATTFRQQIEHAFTNLEVSH